MTRTTFAGIAITGMAGALLLAFRLGLFAPSLAQVEGTPIPQTPLVDLAGHKHTFGELRGQPVTLYFWATWCSPCVSHLAHLARSTDPAAFKSWLPVALEDDPQVVATTLQKVGYRGPMWVATDGMSLLQRRFAGNDKRAVPFEVRLDAAGNISGAKYGE
ncbi:MAG: redoxin domain-containing protein [Frateuria sp.]|uniref:TlpA family protein disulfide reductase n=1 Tax=Frateuria sp. TaxID=2211372 RepID=UPI0017F24F5F|nr:TlpA family protein disulfide reductase [Frateuria sp.]NUO72664.1 redoxin domain-containing protein [Frateuria sp.]NUR23657.1 redoxin domain-containing protein [Frateuria sp.]